MRKIAFVCIYSTNDVRNHICYDSTVGYRKVLTKFGLANAAIHDYAPWIPEIVNSFCNDSNYELHVVCLHSQMKKHIIRYDKNSVYYHFISSTIPFGLRILDKVCNYFEHTDYHYFEKKIKKEIELISPDIICICGAENPKYSVVALENFDCPTIVILQTLLNSARRKQFNFGSQYRRILEKRILSHVKYFMGYEPEVPSLIKEINNEAVVMKFDFPSVQPTKINGIKKVYDFVFYAGGITKNKGIEDAIDALSIVKRSHNGVKMDVVGKCESKYYSFLDSKVKQLGLSNNIHFSGFFKEQSSVFEQVQKSRCVLVPGITAPLNSTVRESMFMGLPTITYSTTATDVINKERVCVIAAQMENVQDLAKKMLYVMNSPVSELETIARNGYEYANLFFSSEAVGKNLRDLFDAVLDDFNQKCNIPQKYISR